ncbi:PEGA domain-containing protein [Spirochaeta lutea]|uniref:PEGA domain-containing protein n=1 Tax=Spirochaeta lutea TaxID=1480694 RepID=A0A098R273_9SPIO|nr:PEGA domain-containing protein [Spirochaeta lutea]KGE73836.1 hypothetical protein DC28_01060 [Spirochaeta lutea]
MKRNSVHTSRIGTLILAALLMILAASGLFAQASAGGRSRGGVSTVTLQIDSNIRGANVYINNDLQNRGAPLTLELRPGTYSIRVTAKGYQDFETTVNLTGNQTIRADLQPPQFSLSVNTNVSNAQVFVNGNRIGTGNSSASLNPGTYTIRVTADGFQEYSGRVTLNGNQTVSAILQPVRHTLTVNSNVKEASVYINGDRLGDSGVSTSLPRGTYTIRVTAPGYQEFTTNLTLTGNQTLQAALQPLNGRLSLAFPNNTANVFYFVNGTRYQVNSRSGRSDLDLPPGNYRIKFTAGGIESPEVLVTIQAGQTTALTPVLGFE